MTWQFSDTPPPALSTVASARDAPQASAAAWLEQQGWQQVWPPALFGPSQRLFFAGPPGQRYLRVYANKTYYILTREARLDPQQLPWLAITWGIDRFPHAAALDVHGRNDRALVILVSFGEKVGSPGLLPNVPRALALFWGETERVGETYTCVTPRYGPAETRLQCKYPHVKYLALRQGSAGRVYTDQVNLVEQFQVQFPEYWAAHQQVPPVVAVSLEASSGKTQSVTSARLYGLSFRPLALDADVLPASAPPVAQTPR
ncbi:MAG: DUF3047 domain-containing protein [Candidatus Tectimicrobiota bacterium]